ncbi:MAG: type II secretion system F family protein, partial [Mogibacterium sp.]|nr:type II secretion system F family protein [Mogibacterium sp.]
MLLVAISVAITVFLIVVAILSGNSGKGEKLKNRLQNIRQLDTGTAEQKKRGINLKKLANFLVGSKPKKKKKSESKHQKNKVSELDKLLMLAEIDLTGRQWNALKYFFSALFAVAACLLLTLAKLDAKRIILAGAFVFAISVVLIGRIVTNKVKKKKTAIRRDLPDIIDLLVVSVEAGLGFDAALIRLYERNQCTVMEELMRAQKDQQHGLSRRDAYTSLMTRCDSKEITNFGNAVIQAEQMGISMKTILISQAEALRESRMNRAYEQAEKAPV